jgi:hypothetical protein
VDRRRERQAHRSSHSRTRSRRSGSAKTECSAGARRAERARPPNRQLSLGFMNPSENCTSPLRHSVVEPARGRRRRPASRVQRRLPQPQRTSTVGKDPIGVCHRAGSPQRLRQPALPDCAHTHAASIGIDPPCLDSPTSARDRFDRGFSPSARSRTGRNPITS